MGQFGRARLPKICRFCRRCPVPRRRDERGRWNPVNPSHPGAASPLPAMTDDRHADALGVTRRERRQEYQGTGGRDEEAPAPEGAEAPRRHETANPRIRGEDTALRAVKYPHIGSPPINGELPHCFNPRPPEGRATTAGAVACLFQSTTAATNDSRSDAGAGAHGSEYRRGRLRASSGKAGSLPEGERLRAPGLRLA